MLKNLYLEDTKAWEAELSKKRFSDKELKVTVVNKGIILPTRKLPDPNPLTAFAGGVCDKDLNFVAGDRTEKVWYNISSAYTVNTKDIIYLDEDVIYGGALIGHFGHFLTECQNRLWFVVQDSQVDRGGGGKVAFIRDYTPYFDEFFRLMGIEKERIIFVDKPTQFRSVTVPDQAQQFSDKAFTFTKEFLLPYQAIKAHVKPGKKKKIYLTRREFKNVAVCFNEKYFEEFFTERGFEVVSPEKISVEEQISLIMGADEIVATMGTLAHWVVFAKPTARFIMLNRTKNYVSPRQCQLIEAFNFRNYYIVDGSHNFMSADHTIGVNMLGPNKNWKDFVADYFNENIEDDYASLEESLEEYVNLWCERYSDPEKSVVTNSLKDLCRRIITLESGDIKRPLLTYQTHVHERGWGDGWKVENQSSNPIDQERDIQAIKIDFPSHKVYYAVYCNEEESWLEATAPEMAGHVGGHKPIHGMKVRLDEAGAKEFDVLYRMHKFDGTWTPWAKNGEELYSHEQNLNAIQIKLKSIKPAETSAKQISNPQALLMKDDAIYLQGQRQSLI